MPPLRYDSGMAAYREHITVSGTLGIAIGFGSVTLFGFSITQGIVAGIFCWLAGMLPDLDSQSGKPTRELFGLTAALAPLLLLQHTSKLGISPDRAMLFALLMYLIVRYGGSWLLAKLTIHRGMFHSIPAMIIAAQLTFLGYNNPVVRVRLLMASAVALGFLSHLVLDEMYSVCWDGTRLKLNRFAGSAMKFFGKHSLANGATLGILMFLSYACLNSVGVINASYKEAAPDMLSNTSELSDAPAFRMADEPPGTIIQ